MALHEYPKDCPSQKMTCRHVSCTWILGYPTCTWILQTCTVSRNCCYNHNHTEHSFNSIVWPFRIQLQKCNNLYSHNLVSSRRGWVPFRTWFLTRFLIHVDSGNFICHCCHGLLIGEHNIPVNLPPDLCSASLWLCQLSKQLYK